jgi:glycosyltransferase involved in cell wall biosynthesis
MSLVSFVIPAYNAKRWIGETLESVVAQQIANSETIVIDDGSTDGTADFVAEKYSWARLETGPNRGVSAARNRGTELASGDFIQYLDSDDVLPQGSVKARLNALNESGADVAYSDWQRLVQRDDGDFELGEVVARTLESIDPDPEVAAFTDCWCPPVALLYGRGIVERIGRWNERLPIIQDARFLLDAALHGGKFVHVESVGGFYREHGNTSLSRRSNVEFVRDCWTNGVEVEAWWGEHGGITEPRRRALVKVYGGVARASFDNDRETFDAAYAALERLQPGYVPRSPRHLNLAARLVGYRFAEHLASGYRRIKRRVRSAA